MIADDEFPGWQWIWHPLVGADYLERPVRQPTALRRLPPGIRTSFRHGVDDCRNVRLDSVRTVRNIEPCDIFKGSLLLSAPPRTNGPDARGGSQAFAQHVSIASAWHRPMLTFGGDDHGYKAVNSA